MLHQRVNTVQSRWRSAAPQTQKQICPTTHRCPVPPVRAEMEDGPGPSSELQELKNMLLRSPGPSKLPPVYKWLPKSMSGSTRELVRGRRTYTYGMLKPVGTMVLPAYLLGAVAAVTGVSGIGPAATGAAIGAAFTAIERFAQSHVWAQPNDGLHVVITGGSRGLGKALAREMLRAGDRVVITSRTQAAVDEAVRTLKEEVPGAQVHGFACDVSSADAVQALDAAAATALGGHVDVWVNNAAFSGTYKPFMELEPEQIGEVVRTNLLGSLLATRTALKRFARQPRGGHVFLMEGAGSDGSASPRYSVYGATKAGIRQMSKSLQAEVRENPSLAQCRVHTLSPGMILTDLLLDGVSSPAIKQAFNILCEQPETTAAFLAPRIRAAVARGCNSGAHIAYLTPLSALGRLATAPARLGRFFDSDGKPVYIQDERARMATKAAVRAINAARRLNSGLTMAYSLSVALCVLAVVLESGVQHG